MPAGCCSPQISDRCHLYCSSQQGLRWGLARCPIHEDQPHILCLFKFLTWIYRQKSGTGARPQALLGLSTQPWVAMRNTEPRGVPRWEFGKVQSHREQRKSPKPFYQPGRKAQLKEKKKKKEGKIGKKKTGKGEQNTGQRQALLHTTFLGIP